MRFRWLWPWAALFLVATPAWSQERVLTLEEALALAREGGVSVVLAKGRIEEARARQIQAGRRFQENPVLEVDAGPRFAERDSLDVAAAVSQGLYSGRRRSARAAGAQAALERAEADLAEARRLLLRDVWTAFVRALGSGTGSRCWRATARPRTS